LCYFGHWVCLQRGVVDALCKVVFVCCGDITTDLSRDTGIHVSDIAATMQSLGLISPTANNPRYSLIIDQEVLDKQRAVHEKLKNMKLDPALLSWSPHLSTSAVEVEESRVEIEVTAC